MRKEGSLKIISIGKMFSHHHHPNSENDLKLQNLWQHLERKLLVPLNSQLSGSTFNSPRQKSEGNVSKKSPPHQFGWIFGDSPSSLWPPSLSTLFWENMLRTFPEINYQNFCSEDKKFVTTWEEKRKTVQFKNRTLWSVLLLFPVLNLCIKHILSEFYS